MDMSYVLRPDILVFLVPILGILTGMVAIIAAFAHKTAKARMENELKRDMLEQGYSPEDVATVINAGKKR